MDKIFKTGNDCKVTGTSDYRDIRIYINDILHIIIPRPTNEDNKARDSIFLQSYLSGNKKHKIYYIEVQHEKGNDYYGYDNFETWKQILKILDENI